MWGLHARERWLGVTLTGLAVGGAGNFWHVALGLFSGLLGKYQDEAANRETTADVHGLPSSIAWRSRRAG